MTVPTGSAKPVLGANPSSSSGSLPLSAPLTLPSLNCFISPLSVPAAPRLVGKRRRPNLLPSIAYGGRQSRLPVCQGSLMQLRVGCVYSQINGRLLCWITILTERSAVEPDPYLILSTHLACILYSLRRLILESPEFQLLESSRPA
jgi:hypothetical protein